MSKLVAQTTALLNRFPGRGSLLLAIMLFAASNSIVRKLTLIGEQQPIDGRNPISFCNVLFVGNLCALLALVPLYYRQWNVQNLRKLSWLDWLNLMGVAILAGAIAPALTFFALDLTAVNNVILIGQLGPPLSLALSVWLLKERVNFSIVTGAVVAFIGVGLTALLSSGEAMISIAGSELGRGELFAIGSAIAVAISTLMSKVTLDEIPLGIFIIFRTTLGTVVFFITAVILFGFEHFRDVFSPFLWQWMLLYGAVIVAGGQLLLYTGIQHSSTSDYSLASSFSPIAGVLAAYLILGEAPTLAQYLGGTVILLGILLNQRGISRRSATTTSMTAAESSETSMRIGFKGI